MGQGRQSKRLVDASAFLDSSSLRSLYPDFAMYMCLSLLGLVGNKGASKGMNINCLAGVSWLDLRISFDGQAEINAFPQMTSSRKSILPPSLHQPIRATSRPVSSK